MLPQLNKFVLLFLLCAVVETCFGQAPVRLTLQEAEALAVKNHPQILAAQHDVNYANQQIVETRAAYYPGVTGVVTGSQGNDLSRIGAGDLSASRLFDRFGQGVVLSQLITDSGRTPSLVASSRLSAHASEQNLTATRYDVLLAVNRAYFEVLRSQAVVRVAQETVTARQTLSDQVGELAKNKLRSDLDLNFAEVEVSQAKLLLLQAQNAVQSARAELARVTGSDQVVNYQLVDQELPGGPPATADNLVAQAEKDRPEIASLRFARDAAYKFTDAERDLKRPTVQVAAVGGFIPFINTPVNSPIPSEYEGVAANLSIPIFNGHLFSAREEAARQHAQAADQQLRNEQEIVARDVRVAWANATTAFQRIDVSAQFLREAAMALDLAQGRYNLGLASIVELTQSQLNVTQAEIENLNAKYDYESQYASLQYTIGALR